MTPFEKLDNDVRAEWLRFSVTATFVDSLRALRDQIATGLLESIKAGTLAEHTLYTVGGELRAVDQILDILHRRGQTRG